jgi:hypothetical protein
MAEQAEPTVDSNAIEVVGKEEEAADAELVRAREEVGTLRDRRDQVVEKIVEWVHEHVPLSEQERELDNFAHILSGAEPVRAEKSSNSARRPVGPAVPSEPLAPLHAMGEALERLRVLVLDLEILQVTADLDAFVMQSRARGEERRQAERRAAASG